MSGIDRAMLALRPIIKDLAIDGTISPRDEGVIRERLEGFEPGVVDQVITRARSDASFFRRTFDNLRSTGTLGALAEPTFANIRTVNRNYTHHKADAMVDQNTNWFGANLKEAELGQAFAKFLREDGANANNVLQHTLSVTSEHVSLNNRDEVAVALLAELSDPELVSLLSTRSLCTLSDSLRGVYFHRNTPTSRQTISEGYVTEGEQQALHRVEWALAEKTR